MKKRVFTVFLCIAVLVSLTACGSEKKDTSALGLMKKGTLTVGVEIGYPPFEDFAKDGVTPVGYDVDFVKAVGSPLST